jgi:hypothetical protein
VIDHFTGLYWQTEIINDIEWDDAMSPMVVIVTCTKSNRSRMVN